MVAGNLVCGDPTAHEVSPDVLRASSECVFACVLDTSRRPAERLPTPRTDDLTSALSLRVRWPCSYGQLWSGCLQPDRSWCRGRAAGSTNLVLAHLRTCSARRAVGLEGVSRNPETRS